jgi:leucyl-tRNA synthetase
MCTEIEAKLKVDSLEEIEHKLTGLGAEFLAVQVNGKIKDRIVVAAEADEEQIKQKALTCEKVIAAMAGKEPKKIIVIKSRLVNIVI